MSRIVDLAKTCPCVGWSMNMWRFMNVERVAASFGEKYVGKKLTHCPWCGEELKAYATAEG